MYLPFQVEDHFRLIVLHWSIVSHTIQHFLKVWFKGSIKLQLIKLQLSYVTVKLQEYSFQHTSKRMVRSKKRLLL